jgi:hypothetical protein
MSPIKRAVTYAGLKIIGKLATILEVEPGEFESPLGRLASAALQVQLLEEGRLNLLPTA